MIKSRRRGANKQVLVSWCGYLSIVSLIPASSLVNFSAQWRRNNFFWYFRVTVVCIIFRIIQHPLSELPHSVVLHGQWEVAISEIQFPCSFLHVRYNENVRFVDVKPDKGTNVYLRQKKLHFQMEFKTVSVGDLAACTIDL